MLTLFIYFTSPGAVQWFPPRGSGWCFHACLLRQLQVPADCMLCKWARMQLLALEKWVGVCPGERIPLALCPLPAECPGPLTSFLSEAGGQSD